MRTRSSRARGHRHVIQKLSALGIKLGYPHSSKVVGADNLRELRPRAGRSRVRPLFTDGSVRPLLLPRSAPKRRATRPDTNAPFVSRSKGSPRSSDRRRGSLRGNAGLTGMTETAESESPR